MQRLLGLSGLVVFAAVVGACATNASPWDTGNGDDAGNTTPGDDAGSQPTQDSGKPSSNDAGTTLHDSGTPPTQDAGGGFDAGDGFDQFQHHNLDVVNMYRAKLNVAPLVLDAQLCTFALAGSQELTQDHTPHQHFITAGNNQTLWTSGFNTQAGENQGDPNGWYKMSTNAVTNELDQIDDIQLQMYNEGPGTGEAHGHYMNMMNSKFKRLGVGLIEVNSELYLTNDFSD
jgi:uncharacterized protein YkwD